MVNVRAGIFYDVFNVFVKERNNGLFSEETLGYCLDFPSFADQFSKCCIVDFDNFFV